MTKAGALVGALVGIGLLGGACAVKVTDTSGCVDDSECRQGRVCVERRCEFSEEAAALVPASQLAQSLLTTLTHAAPREFASLWPDTADYLHAFDFATDDSGAPDEKARALITAREVALSNAFSARLGDGRDYANARFLRFEPGRLEPILQGYDHARRGLETLRDSRVVFTTDNGATETSFTIHTLLLTRGRWRLLQL